MGKNSYFRTTVDVTTTSNMALNYQQLSERKNNLSKRLKQHGIKGYEISFLQYVDETQETFVQPIEAGKRMMILYAVVHTAFHFEDREKLRGWLKDEHLWDDLGPKEKRLFDGLVTEEEELIDFSWKVEAAYILAWALGLVKERPSPTDQITDEQAAVFTNNLPHLLTNLSSFYNGLQYIDLSEIYLENLFNELATTYFRDLLFNGKKDETDIDRKASFERHRALNWLRSFGDIKEWEETDTST